MKNLLVLFIFVLFLTGCFSNLVSPPVNPQTGNILFKIDRENAPENVHTVTAYLTRSGFNPISVSLNLLSDSTADLNLNNIPAGQWHLKVEASDSVNVVQYRGETDVTIVQGITIQVSLTLLPVSNGTGNIYIFVTWGEPNHNWIDYINNPIFEKIPSQGNPLCATQSKVLFDEGKYKMWYNNVYNNGVCSIWYAESNNGINWTPSSEVPVLAPGAYYWNSHAVVVGNIIRDDSGYKMYFTGMESVYGTWRVGMAVSTNGINWEILPNPILSPEPGQTVFGLNEAIKKDSIYYIFFGFSLNGARYINVATSSDGYNWTKYSGNPVLSPTHSWENSGVMFPAVIYDNNKFRMIYQNIGETGFGEATSVDGFNWVKNTQNPIIKNTDVHNNWCNYIAYPNFRKFNNEYRIYYTGTISGYNIKFGMFRKFN